MALIDMENEPNNQDRAAGNQSKGATGNESNRVGIKEENSQSKDNAKKTGAETKSANPGQSANEDAGVLSQVQDTGRDLAAKSLNAIGEKTRSTTEGYKSDITGGLHTLAEGLRQASATFNNQADDNPISSAGARYIGDLAGKIESASGYFERKDAAALMSDVKGFARRNPTVFVGAAFATGFALSRMIRSSMATSSTSSVSASPMRG